jgi:hypothetical protein
MKIQVFDPPMCCSTGLCGPSVDPKLVEFSANLDWLKHQGIEVERYNLSQQTAAFVNNILVRDLLQKDGNQCLPIILVNGAIASQGVYPAKADLAKLAGVELPKSSSVFNLTITPSGVESGGCCAPDSGQESCCDDTEENDSKSQSCCS